jgi:Rieske Fe-S protein
MGNTLGRNRLSTVGAQTEGDAMGRCEVCGNDYDKAFEVVAAGDHHMFDSFECAIHRMAPICEHCGCKVIGHGAEVEGRFYCCAHCARETEQINEVRDRVDVAT